MRVEIYYTPGADHPLARAAAAWLGRTPFPFPDAMPAKCDSAGAADDLVAEPRRYGFHATLKAPFRLADGRTVEELAEALASFCQTRTAPALGPLRIADLGQFIALVPDGPRPDLEALAADAVCAFEAFRAPLDAVELARRRSAGLTARQEDHLSRWGYPYVFEEFRFHMTLTGRVGEHRRDGVMSLLQKRFNALLDSTPALDGVALFVEPERQADFNVHRLFGLAGGAGVP